MDKFVFKKASAFEESRSSKNQKKDDDKVNLGNLEADPELRKKITKYHPNIQDEVRRAYLLGP